MVLKEREDLVQKIQEDPYFKDFSDKEMAAILSFVKYKHPIPYHLARVATKAARELEEKYPENFYGLCIFGSLTNGSYLTRFMVNGPDETDLDCALIGKDLGGSLIEDMREIFLKYFRPEGIKPCIGENGTHNLDLDSLTDNYTLRYNYPFRAVFGPVKKRLQAQAKIIEHIEKTNRSLWAEIQNQCKWRMEPKFKDPKYNKLKHYLWNFLPLRGKKELYALDDLETVKQRILKRLERFK